MIPSVEWGFGAINTLIPIGLVRGTLENHLTLSPKTKIGILYDLDIPFPGFAPRDIYENMPGWIISNGPKL